MLLLTQVPLHCVERQHSSSTFVTECYSVVLLAVITVSDVARCGREFMQGYGYQWLNGWWRTVLPVVLQLMSHVQQKLLPHNAAPASTASMVSSSSNSGAAAARTVLLLVQLLTLASVHACLCEPTLSAQPSADDSANDSEGASPSIVAIDSCWYKHSVQISAALDSILRSVVSCGHFSASDAAQMCGLFASGGAYVRDSHHWQSGTCAAVQHAMQLPEALRPHQAGHCCCGLFDAHLRVALGAASVLSELTEQGAAAAAAAAAAQESQQALAHTDAAGYTKVSKDLSEQPCTTAAVMQQPAAHADSAALAAAGLPAARALPTTERSKHWPRTVAAAVAEGLPWLVLIGRCCLYFASELQQQQQQRQRQQESSAAEVQSMSVQDSAAAALQQPGADMLTLRGLHADMHLHILQDCEQWLQHGNTTAHVQWCWVPSRGSCWAVDCHSAAWRAVDAVTAVAGGGLAYIKACHEQSPSPDNYAHWGCTVTVNGPAPS